ncbi:hypothetical protein HMF8227_02359 [Saliniradius amylolyticus]|uniref:Gp5/Type VI secretion system Vgr protein OB-fold domain-containing protein n=1 Tax=Saliniradius amylolyticus TaxID=2183582 RepID=A0A2S2E577_9ALTE|nr:phage baseplate assembly protein V [Saliniradius amylolyticus]AWL12811.1 hypothetical protein HMF8227_02359 [Saliniradius amylolyticus]
MKQWVSRLLSKLFLTGVIEEVQASPLRYKVRFDENRLSNWLIPLVRHASTEKVWEPLEVGEQVLVLLPFGLSRGFVLGSLWRNESAQPKDDLDLFYREFADGAYIQYHRTNKQLDFYTPGKAVGTADGGFELTGDMLIKGKITHEGDFNQTGKMDVSGQITSSTEVEADGTKLTSHKHKDVTAGTALTGEPE